MQGGTRCSRKLFHLKAPGCLVSSWVRFIAWVEFSLFSLWPCGFSSRFSGLRTTIKNMPVVTLAALNCPLYVCLWCFWLSCKFTIKPNDVRNAPSFSPGLKVILMTGEDCRFRFFFKHTRMYIWACHQNECYVHPICRSSPTVSCLHSHIFFLGMTMTAGMTVAARTHVMSSRSPLPFSPQAWASSLFPKCPRLQPQETKAAVSCLCLSESASAWIMTPVASSSTTPTRCAASTSVRWTVPGPCTLRSASWGGEPSTWRSSSRPSASLTCECVWFDLLVTNYTVLLACFVPAFSQVAMCSYL